MSNQTNISQEEFERFESYFLNEMPVDDRFDFEKELETNKAFSAKFQSAKAILEGIEENALRENLESFHHELSDNETIKSKRFPWLGVAASFILLLGLFTWVFLIGPNEEEQLFLTHYQPDPGLVTAMGSSMEYEFDRGMVDYKLGDYEAAIVRWEKIIQEKPENDTLQYFLGAAHLDLKNSDKALFYFERVLEVETSKFTDEATWYLGLIYLLKRDLEQARIMLEKSSHPDAEKLLKSLPEK
ncbi:tetratricopeptide repeat protein [Lunatibacter salilacus]|uniref:tetratricopeptide repeat protein n=1 Tax=Lunatibacter salilacus TaxID=2483804 RepID=UPI00131B090E|nr:tetratricopeptide repeat protein [Lunatibacter salilacus]